MAAEAKGASPDAIAATIVDDLVGFLAARGDHGRRPVVALSGIDGSGKTTVAALVVELLARRGLRAALLPLDDWRTPASVRFVGADPAHFRAQAYRFDDLFALAIEPLRATGTLELELGSYGPGADVARRQPLHFDAVDLVLVEGIFLLRHDLVDRWDRTYWLECPPDVALARSLARNQEGQDADELRRDYERIYVPAQRLHRAADAPHERADVVVAP